MKGYQEKMFSSDAKFQVAILTQNGSKDSKGGVYCLYLWS